MTTPALAINAAITDALRFERAIAAFDTRNAADPNQDSALPQEPQAGQPQPKELLYAQRMTDMLLRFAPEASEALQLAARCQHIERWKIARTDFPMTKGGYHRWRNRLKDLHAEIAAEVLTTAGYASDLIARVAALVRKELPLADAEMQTLEDVIVLVFVEYYLQDFVDAHPEYDTPKLLDILRKTLRKTSAAGRQAALTMITLPPALVPAIQSVMREEGWLD